MTRPANLAATLRRPGLLRRMELWARGDAPAAIRRRGAAVALAPEPWGHWAPTPGQRRLLRLVRRSPLFRPALRLHAALALDRMRPGPVDDLYWGARLRFYPSLTASFRHMLLTPRGYEAGERAFLAAAAGTGAFVDIGANSGAYALWAARHLGPRPVIAFEPMPLFAAILRQNAAFSEAPDLRVVEAAAAGSDGTVAFSPSEQSVAFGHDTVEMPARALLSVLAEQAVARIGALKIDAECTEDRILFPFFEAAPAALWPRAILIEYAGAHLWERDAMAMLAGLGYAVAFRNHLNAGLVRAGP